MNIPFLDLSQQYHCIKDEINKTIEKVLENSSFIKGEEVEKFERDFASIHNVKNCVGVANGTDALIIALKVLNIGQGDEVIVPANSFIATSEAVSAVGAKVVFVDNDPSSYCMDVNKIKEKITPETKAVIPVHLYGQAADMDPLMELAKTNGIRIIEDSAQAHLSEYRSKELGWAKVGNLGDIATFSFYPGKNLGAYGDAGAILTNNDELALKARMYANHGRLSKYNHEIEGLNSRLDNIQAAVLNVKLTHLSDWTGKRRAAAGKYLSLLRNITEIVLPVIPENTQPVWHLFVIRSKRRNELLKFLNSKGIHCGIHYPIALPNQPAYRYLGHTKSDFPVASRFQDEIMSLPIFPEISDEQIEFVADNIKGFFNNS